ncbi:unnamed protein product [Paramecium pentaurelia]|uniref:Uncharacterized protein n=1 Tax=Paramecium pentaurelia TaxID=43138 RepID=A0A8S1WGX9_9CILI|nr:unnamed protein product [Paramecium pentaurelia]
MIEQSDKNKQNDLIVQLRNLIKNLERLKDPKHFIGNHTIFCRSRYQNSQINIKMCLSK